MDKKSMQEEAQTRRMLSTPQTTEEDKTQRMDSRGASAAGANQDAVPTRHASVIDSVRRPNARSMPLGALEPNTVLNGDCVVIRTHHNHESTRPGLFECQSPEGRVMVKVAATDFPPQPNLWDKLCSLNHPHVLRIFRTNKIDGRFYEVQEFCTGGTLADYVPSAGSDRPIPPARWVEQALVPSFHAGISYLHQQGIVHRDIKPSNLYLREANGRKTLVIGDFDISSVLQNGRTSRSTERAAGTWIYSAPEAFPRFVDNNASQLGSAVVRSSDYYSFGVVIVELLLGTTSLHQAQLPDLYEFYLQGGRVEIPDGLSPRLSELLQGLLCRNRHRRWGGDEVGRWLNHQTNDDDRRRIEEDRGYQLGRRIAAFTAFETTKPASLSELSQAMAQEPKIALDELMSSDVMLNWVGSLDARLARLIRQDREKWRSHPRLALLCARLRLDPAAPLPIDAERQATSAAEWARYGQAAVIKGTTTAEKLCRPEALQELETWLRLKAVPELDAAKHVADIATYHGVSSTQDSSVVASKPSLILEEIFWALLPERPFLLTRGVTAKTPQQIAQLALGEISEWKELPPAQYISTFNLWKGGFLEAYLRQRLSCNPDTPSPLLQQMQKARHDFQDKPFVAFEIVLRLLDPSVAPIEMEFNPKAFQDILETRYGEQAVREIAYRAKGRGMPFAALQLQCQKGGLQLDNYEILHRRGCIKVYLRSHYDIPVRRKLRATLSLTGNTTRLAGNTPSLFYKITYPIQNTVRKVVIGALAGAVLLGSARAALMPVVPHALRLQDVEVLACGTWSILFGVLLLTLVVGARLWFWALAKHAR